MAKLTKKDKEFLKKNGYLEEDFNQIEKLIISIILKMIRESARRKLLKS